MKIKRMICALLICAVSGICCACGNSSDSSENILVADTTESEETTATPATEIGTATIVVSTTSTTTVTETIVTTMLAPVTVMPTTTAFKPKTDKDIMYEEFYDFLLYVGEGTGFFTDIDGDGYEDMVLGGTDGLYVITRNNIDNDEEGYFGFTSIVNLPEYYLVAGTDGKNYVCCDTKKDDKLTRLYCSIYNDKEVEVRIGYDIDNDGGYKADWYISEPDDLFSFLNDGKENVSIMYDIPQSCLEAINTTLPQFGINVDAGSSYTRMESMSFSAMKEYLLGILGRSSSMVNNNDPNEQAMGEGTVHTDGGQLNVRQSPSTDSQVVAQLNNGANVYIIDDSYDGWLLVNSFDSNYRIYRGYVSAEYVNWHMVN